MGVVVRSRVVYRWEVSKDVDPVGREWDDIRMCSNACIRAKMKLLLDALQRAS